MSLPLWAGFWGLIGGSALVIGAGAVYVVHFPQRVIAAVTAFGSGVLISALSLELMEEAYRQGGFDSTSAGFIGGAAAYTVANIYLSRRGAKHRKRSGCGPDKQPHADQGGGTAIAVGALLDGIPESIVIGVSLLQGKGVSLTAVAAVFLSNLPEGLSSAAGMRKAGRTPRYVFGVWCGIAAASAVAAYLGNLLLAGASPELVAATNAIAAGAILAMISDTMMPEAFEHAHEFAGLITVTGFLAAFVLSKLGG
jgi:ZIP family zinc transporter